MRVPRADHPSQSFGHKYHSAAASLQVELRNLDGNKLLDQPGGETKYQSVRRYSRLRPRCRWPGRSSSDRKCRRIR